MDPIFIKGIVAFSTMLLVFVGSVYLLLSMILGPRLGYLVLGSCFFGVMVLLSSIWVVTALGPKGPETTWNPLSAGPSLSTIDSEFGHFDVSDYPEGSWQAPAKGQHLADLSGDDDTQREFENAKPVLDAFLGQAVSPIPGLKAKVEKQLTGSLDFTAGKFEVTDVKMRQDKVQGKDSVVAVGRVVSSDVVTAGALSDGAKEGKVASFLVKPGDSVLAGEEMLTVKTDKGTVNVASDKKGKVISFGLRKGDKIKQGVPFAKVDVSGQPGAAEPGLVAAARVRGGVRIPSFYYLAASLLMFALHLGALSRAERSRDSVPQPA